MADLFISYARADKKDAEAMARACKAATLDVFWDVESIGPGEDWSAKIQEALPNCQAVIYLATPNSVESQSVNNELGMAIQAKRTIVPILAGVMADQLPSMVQKFNAVDVTHGTPEERGASFLKLAQQQAAVKQQREAQFFWTLLISGLAIWALCSRE